MLSFSRIVGFDWDAGNARKSKDKHGVEQQEAESVFVDPAALVTADVFHSDDEPRFHALGRTPSGRRLQVTFTLRSDDTLIRVISARDMSQKERSIYGQERRS